ncbi:MAG: hypothetical protein GX491_20195 [Chloroflexi bacterium]|nr:hypothetical protein [Chloroflexota bacterium]
MTTPTEKDEKEGLRGTLYETTRMILLAGIGAVSLAQDEINNFLNRLVERGEMAESDARKLVREVMERREKLERERREAAFRRREEAKGASAAGQQITRADLEALNARIAELTRQIEELRRQQGEL